MDAQTLRDQWEQHKDRPAFVIEHREELAEHTDTSDPIPTDGIYDVRQWLQSYKGTVTRQLNEAVGGGGTDEPDEGDGMAGDRDIDGEATEGE